MGASILATARFPQNPFPHTARQMERLNEIAAQVELACDFRRYTSRKRNGWPVESERPFCLFWKEGGQLVASFPTIDGLEKSIRARAGC